MSNNVAGDKLPISARLDRDTGLKAKGRLLSITSLLFIGIMLTGAKIEEANTFIFKVTVSNQAGIPSLLFLSIIFITIRHYSYAKPYHDELQNKWTKRLLDNPFFLSYDDQSDDLNGLVYEIQPSGFGLGDPEFGYNNNDSHSYGYSWGPPFSRSIYYSWYIESYGADVDAKKSIVKSAGLLNYFKAIRLEIKYQAQSLITDREYLDIFGPYLIAILAVVSFIFRSDMQSFVSMLMDISN